MPSISLHEDPAVADRLDKLRDETHRLANIWRLLSVISSVAGVVTVVGLLISVHPAPRRADRRRRSPGLVTARSRRHYNLLVTDTERYRRLANKVSEVLRDPGQAVEVRAFGLYETLTEVARRAFDAYRMLFTVSLRRYADPRARSPGSPSASSTSWPVCGCSRRARAGENSVGDVTLLLLVGAQITTTGAGIASNAHIIVDSLNAFDRYLWLREYADDHSWASSTRRPPGRLADGIRFENVGFSYPAGSGGAGRRPAASGVRHAARSAVSGVDLHLPAGRTVAFVGDNGAGKTTLVKLLSRLYDPTEGRILIDGIAADRDRSAGLAGAPVRRVPGLRHPAVPRRRDGRRRRPRRRRWTVARSGRPSPPGRPIRWSPSCPTGSTPSWARSSPVASGCPAGSGNGSRSPGRSCGRRRC